MKLATTPRLADNTNSGNISVSWTACCTSFHRAFWDAGIVAGISSCVDDREGLSPEKQTLPVAPLGMRPAGSKDGRAQGVPYIMGTIVSVNFRGDELYGFKQDDGVYLALKPMVEAMGLDWSAQLKRVKRDPILSEGVAMMTTPFGRGGDQECVCIRLDLVNGWLFTIDSSRITAEETRQRVQTYQRECYTVLHDHFAGKRQPLIGANDDVEPDSSPSMNERRSLVAEARQTFGAMAARQLWFNQGLPLVPAMMAAQQNDVDLFHYGMVNTAGAA